MCIPPVVSRQRLGKHIPTATNTRNSKINFGHVLVCGSFYVSPYRFYLELSQDILAATKNVMPVLYSACVVSKERRRLVLLKTSCTLRGTREGGLYRLHCRPSSSRRRRKVNPVPGVKLSRPVVGGGCWIGGDANFRR
jgi:hypothetical protein